VVTSRISRSAGAQSFGGAHRGTVYVRVFKGVSVRACCEHLRCTVRISKKSVFEVAGSNPCQYFFCCCAFLHGPGLHATVVLDVARVQRGHVGPFFSLLVDVA
jgi:hypothetical protein